MRKPIEFNRILRVGMMLVLPFGLASCAPDEGEEMGTPEETPLPETDTGMTAAEPVTVDIEGVNSDVTGEATLSRVGESVMVSLSLENLTGEGPFRGQILSGRCEDRERMMGTQPGGAPGDTGATPSTPSPGAQTQGQVLATLEPIQTSGAGGTGQPGQTGTQGQTAMSHSTISVSDLQGHTQAFIEIQGEGARTIACGDIDNLSQLMAGGTGGANMTPSTGTPGTTPGSSTTPGSRP